MNTLPLPRLASTGLSAPTGDDFRSLIFAVQPEGFRATWTDICERAQLHRNSTLLDIPALEALSDATAAVPGVVGTVGRAMSARVKAYAAMSAMPGSDQWAPTDWSRRALNTLITKRIPDAARLAEVASLDAFSASHTYKLNAIARQASETMGTEVGLVNALLDGAQYFLGSSGIDDIKADMVGTPIEWALCARMVRTAEPFVLTDASTDLVEQYNPLVRFMGYHSYAGAPMISNGHVVGSVCVWGRDTKEFGTADLAELQRIAASAVEVLQVAKTSENSVAESK